MPSFTPRQVRALFIYGRMLRYADMDEDALKRAIGGRSGPLYTIGITNDPARRKKEHEQDGENTKYWHHWEADSKSVAEAVENHFIGKKMKGGTGGNTDGSKTVYVYIF